ncbi:MAG: hypothetical protein NUV48_14050 [Peptococcaceae bacterium]|jgi:hypothetical protein|nr:hypothetical protein [Peptococcaceae bacterium]
MVKRNTKLQFVCADFSCKDNTIFDLDDDRDGINDLVDDCLVWTDITFYGIFSDEQYDKALEMDYRELAKLGRLTGRLILCKYILLEDSDPFEVCDAESAELGYAISVLTDRGGPLNRKTGDPFQDVFYIHELKMEKEYEKKSLKRRILIALPNLIFSFLHVLPEILACCPAPLICPLSPAESERYETLQKIASQKIESALGLGNKEPGNVVKFADSYQFSHDELNLVLGRGGLVPCLESKKTLKEYALYESAGFKKLGDSGLLVKQIVSVSPA